MKHIKYLHILLTIIILQKQDYISAQNKYWVFLTDKANTTFDPATYFDAKAIERRLLNNIPLYDSSDFPLNGSYILAVEQKVNQITSESRWFNALAVSANINQIKEVEKLYCVKAVEAIYIETYPTSFIENKEISETDSALLKKQIISMQGELFEQNKITGKGIRVAIFDGGFPGVDVNPAFEHIRSNNRIIKTWDFCKKKEFVYSFNTHGTNVISCIAGIIDGKKIGLASDAEFLLARTEVNAEPFSEEENWLAAAEWADKNGANIINSSLGYTYHRYFPYQMNGKKSLVARAANMAASKGILVVNAMGNDGDNSWKIAGTPADADSVLSVGGIDPYTNYHINFSSFGPTSDKRMKPNVCAYGNVIAMGKSELTNTFGTSFASPLVAGFAACALQTNPTLTNMQLFKEIEKSANLYPYFDYAHGFGIPQAEYFVNKNQTPKEKSFDVKTESDTAIVTITEDAFNNKANNYLYYKIEGVDGKIKKYFVIDVYQRDALKIPISSLKKKDSLIIHFKGYTENYKF